MDTLPPMFDEPHPPPLVPAGEPTGYRHTRKPPDPDAIRWSKYRPKERVPCDHCLRDLLAPERGPVARAARWRRKHRDNDLLLCGAHMELQRHADGLDPLDDANGRLV